jgi:hypothetical protein
LLADIAQVTGLDAGLDAVAAAGRRRRSVHGPGRVLVDLAVMLADGGEAISDLAVLRDQPGLFGSVASTATAWRTLDGGLTRHGPGGVRRTRLSAAQVASALASLETCRACTRPRVA